MSERLAESVAELKRRRTLAVAALGVVMAVRAWDVGTRQWSIGIIREIPAEGADDLLMQRLTAADALVDASVYLIPITFILTAAMFLRWLHRLIVLARELDATVPYTPSQAVWAWFIPFVSLIRPYQVVAAVHQALEPERVAPPMPRVDRSAPTDYRSVAFTQPSPAVKLPSALLGFWWGAFVVMSIGSRIAGMSKMEATAESVISAYHGAMFVGLVSVLAAGLAITVVRGLTARAEERFRRIRESTPEELAAQGIELAA